MKNTTEFTVSDTLLHLVKTCEGFRQKAYRCPGGVMTVGYGHTGSDVTFETILTKQQAETILKQDLTRTRSQVLVMTQNLHLTPNQIDALTSLAFNIGINALNNSTLLRKVVKNPHDPSIETEFSRWVYANGVKMPGLVKRRQMEYGLYNRKN